MPPVISFPISLLILAMFLRLVICPGGDGTAGNHWESKVFKGELMDGMSGAPNERAVFSAITLALIDDTGWYNANWNLQVPQSSSLPDCHPLYLQRQCPVLFCSDEVPDWALIEAAIAHCSCLRTLQGRLGFGRDAGCSFVSRDCSSRNHLVRQTDSMA